MNKPKRKKQLFDAANGGGKTVIQAINIKEYMEQIARTLLASRNNQKMIHTRWLHNLK